LRQPAHEGAADAEDVKVQGVVLSMSANGRMPAGRPRCPPDTRTLCGATKARILGKPGGTRSRRAGPLHRYTDRLEITA